MLLKKVKSIFPYTMVGLPMPSSQKMRRDKPESTVCRFVGFAKRTRKILIRQNHMCAKLRTLLGNYYPRVVAFIQKKAIIENIAKNKSEYRKSLNSLFPVIIEPSLSIRINLILYLLIYPFLFFSRFLRKNIKQTHVTKNCIGYCNSIYTQNVIPNSASEFRRSMTISPP